MATQPIGPQPVPQPKGMRPPPVPGGVPGGPPGAGGGKPPVDPTAKAGQPGAEGEPPEGEQGQLGFFQLPWVQNILPFITSLTLHATIIVIALLTVQVVKAISKPPTQEQD